MIIRKSISGISLIGFVLVCFAFTSVYAQEAVTGQENGKSDPDHIVQSSDGNNNSKAIVRNGILFGTVPVVFLFGVKAWDWNGDHSFYSRNEGWFGKGTDYAGADKAGHFFAHYMLQRSMYDVFNWTENGESRKWAYSLGVSLSTGLLIEMGDGFSSKYGFSFQDLTMDYAGIILGAVFQRFPVVDGFLGFSTTYYPTAAYRHKFNNHNAVKTALEFVNDYSGWRTMLDIKLAGFDRIGVKLPYALRLMQFNIGYCSRGYANYDRGRFERPKTRNMIFGVSINSAQMLDESFPSDNHGMLYGAAHRALEYYHLPVEKAHYSEF